MFGTIDVVPVQLCQEIGVFYQVWLVAWLMHAAVHNQRVLSKHNISRAPWYVAIYGRNNAMLVLIILRNE